VLASNSDPLVSAELVAKILCIVNNYFGGPVGVRDGYLAINPVVDEQLGWANKHFQKDRS
jgi:hypothetical protein